MDSKEKLEVVRKLQGCGVERYRLALEEVEKDLELLALLRKNIVIKVDYELKTAIISSKKKTSFRFNECYLFNLSSRTLKTLESFKRGAR